MCAFNLTAWRPRVKAPPNPEQAEAKDAIKAMVLQHLAQDINAATSIKVSEIECNDPLCPGLETIILIMTEGKKTRACKIQKAIVDVKAEDIVAALRV